MCAFLWFSKDIQFFAIGLEDKILFLFGVLQGQDPLSFAWRLLLERGQPLEAQCHHDQSDQGDFKYF